MRVLVVGGASSGKSAFAESVVMTLSEKGRGEGERTDDPLCRVYLATMQSFGEEGARRVERHRRLREGKGFVTVERCRDIVSLNVAECEVVRGCARDDAGVLRAAILVEDLGNLLANEMFPDEGAFEQGDGPVLRVDTGMRHLEDCFEHVVAVSNDVGSDMLNCGEETKAYIRHMGRLGDMLAARFDVVVEVTCGIPLVVKGVLPPLDYSSAECCEKEAIA